MPIQHFHDFLAYPFAKLSQHAIGFVEEPKSVLPQLNRQLFTQFRLFGVFHDFFDKFADVCICQPSIEQNQAKHDLVKEGQIWSRLPWAC